jgi:hypothetical protein
MLLHPAGLGRLGGDRNHPRGGTAAPVRHGQHGMLPRIRNPQGSPATGPSTTVRTASAAVESVR